MRTIRKKGTILIAMDPDLLMDLRRVLFEQGIGVEAFFQCVARKVTKREEDMLALVKQAGIERMDKVLQQEFMGKRKPVDKNMLYALIQEELKKDNKEDNEDIAE